jgi:hypothetical protein
MSEKIGSCLVIEETPPGICEVCGFEVELRPYGPGGKKICCECGARDPESTRVRMEAVLKLQMAGTTHAPSMMKGKK